MALATREPPPPSVTPVTTPPFDDWPGHTVFRDLGEFIGNITVTGQGGAIVVGIFRAEDGTQCATYAASTRPYVVGMGSGRFEAIEDWLEELHHKWEMAKELRRPFAPAVDNDFAAMSVFFGITDGFAS